MIRSQLPAAPVALLYWALLLTAGRLPAQGTGCGLTVEPELRNTASCTGRPTGVVELIVAGATGTVSVRWHDGLTSPQLTRRNLPAGDYSGTVTVAGCSADFSGTVPTGPRLGITNVDNDCRTGCLTLGYLPLGNAPLTATVAIDDTERDFVVHGFAHRLCAADLGLDDFAGRELRLSRVVDADGCATELSFRRTIQPTNVGRLDTLICPRSGIFVGEEYFDLPQLTPQRVRLPGRTTRSGCDTFVNVTVDFHPPARGEISPLICANGEYEFRGEGFGRGRQRGEVILRGAARDGCDSTVVVALRFLPVPTAQLDTLLCNGAPDVVIGGVRFGRGNPTGTVVIPGAAANGCDSIITVRVTREDSDEAILTGDGIVCADHRLAQRVFYRGNGVGRITLSSQPGAPFRMAAGDTVVYATVPPGERVTIREVSTSNLCGVAGAGSIEVTATSFSAALSPADTLITDALACHGDTSGQLRLTTLGGRPPYRISWSDGSTDSLRRGLGAGRYAVTVTSARGCAISHHRTLTQPPPLNAELTLQPANCRRPVPLASLTNLGGGVPPYLAAVGSAPFTPVDAPAAALPLPVGPTPVTVQDANGCEWSARVTAPPAPTSELLVTAAPPLVRPGDSVRLSASAPGYELIGLRMIDEPNDAFTPGTDLTFLPPAGGTYLLEGLTRDSCRLTGAVRLGVDNFGGVFAPGAFSPNGDGNNDRYRILADPERVRAVQTLRIFDRWGASVYAQLAPAPPAAAPGWDGRTPGGRAAPAGVYVYLLVLELRDGSTVRLSGNLTLLR